MKVWFILLLSFVAIPVFAQGDTTQQLTFSGFTDVYYTYDFNQPRTHERPIFLYNHNRHNEFNINLAILKAVYSSDKVRGNLALMAGTYAQYNLAAEPDLLRNIYEANVGIRLSKDLWLDAGIFTSHIGLESAISKDNYTLTRGLAAENSPYYESGVKLTYATGHKWLITGLILNGWQNIREPAGNSNKALGTQIQFKPSAHIVLNSSSFIGNEKPDSTKQWRYFHDFYATFQIKPRLKLAAVFDIGAQKQLNTNKYNIWYTPALLLHYGLLNKLGLGVRAEYYQDKKGVIMTRYSPPGFKITGYSVNLDYAPTDSILLRMEGRLLDSQESIFVRNSQPVDKSTAITSSIAIVF
ncbi:hypothetical protein AAE02nite_34080 [Adhaeribacter aerolatus]|uniref:Porin n=1 Tax=Adhaeribacter aerolatus TaxID=670289 RepID=A0A512B190_9BACT|nr:porin [Adhaeribacter aerolatus]GEO05744.1 hypothetical protein AAE02nite_34080 [Adhaeribacter aerolatus]